MYFTNLQTDLLYDHNTIVQVQTLVNIQVTLSKHFCKSSINNFVKSFLTFKNYFDTSLLLNPKMVWPLLPTQSQSSMSLSDTLQTLSLRPLLLTDDGMPHILRHFLLEYWAFAQHGFSIVWSFSDNRILLIFL